MEITDLLKSQLNAQNLSTLSQFFNINDDRKTEAASNAIFSTLLGALTKNAREDSGATGIFNALRKDHDGSIMSDPLGFILGNRQTSNSRMLNGSGIIGHLLGNNVGNVAGMISKATGIDQRTVQSMLPVLAPIVMGAVGKSMRSTSEDQQNPQLVRGMLENTVEKEKEQNPMMDMAAKFLDQDGDGSVVDDLLGMFGKFLRK